MTSADASRLLDLPANATPPQIEARFREARSALEEKIAKALTPGLQERYRASLAELTTAFEILILEAEKNSLPGLSHVQLTSVGSPSGAPKLPPIPSLPPMPVPASPAPSLPPMPAVAAPTAPASPPLAPVAKKSSRGLFAAIAVIVVVALAAGGWWWKQDNEKKAELARLEAGARQQAELARQKAEGEEKERLAAVEREQQAKLFAELRSRLTAINSAFDSVMRGRLAAEGELKDLSARLEGLASEGKSDSPAARLLTARRDVQQAFVAWLNANVPNHPARAARPKAEAAVSGRAADAANLIEAYAKALDQLKADIAAAKSSQAISGPLSLTSNLDETSWHAVDAYGVERSGAAPAKVDDFAFGRATVVFSRAGWPDLTRTVDVSPTQTTLAAEFPIGSLRIESAPAGALVKRGNEELGKTPLDFPQIAPGDIAVSLTQKGFKPAKLSGRIEPGKPLRLAATLEEQKIIDGETALQAALENLPLIADPEARNAAASGFVYRQARERSPATDAAIRAILDIQFAAARDIPDPKTRLTALLFSISIVAHHDFKASEAWADEAVKAATQLSPAAGKAAGVTYMANYLRIHPAQCARLLQVISPWYTNEDWTELATLAGLQRELGNEAEARQLIARAQGEYRNDTIKTFADQGAARRPLLPLRHALVIGDLATAQAMLRRLGGQPIEFSDAIDLIGEFMRLGDFETIREVAQRVDAASQHYLHTTMVIQAFANGNAPYAERYAAGLKDTAEKPFRSDAYQQLAEQYLNFGRRREAVAALANVANFTITDYSDTRVATVISLAGAGEMERARQLAAKIPIAFTKEKAGLLMNAAPMFVALDNRDAFEKAMRYIPTDYPTQKSSILLQCVTALCRQGRIDEADKFQAQIMEPLWSRIASQVLTLARVRAAGDEKGAALLEAAQPGAERAALLQALYQRDFERQRFGAEKL